MTCDEAVLALDGRAPDAALEAHLRACAECREAAAVVGLAALPPVSAAERAALADLPREVLRAARAAPVAPSTWRQVAQLALAAGLGAVLASSVLLGAGRAPPPEPVVREVAVEVPALPEEDGAEAYLSDDEVFFEVSWPDVTTNE